MTPSPRADPNTSRNAVPAAIGSRTSDQRRVSDLGLSDLGSDPSPADPEGKPAGEGAKPEPRYVVDCDEECGAFEEPKAPKEIKAAYEHWRGHRYLSGCAHGW